MQILTRQERQVKSTKDIRCQSFDFQPSEHISQASMHPTSEADPRIWSLLILLIHQKAIRVKPGDKWPARLPVAQQAQRIV
jgi:hypothetical protein